MNINDKIAARRKEVELERQQVAAAELVRQRAEHEAKQEGIRIAKLEAAAVAVKSQKPIEMPGYMISGRMDPLPSRSTEMALLNESLELVTKSELFIFLMLVVISIFNIVRVEMGRTLFFGVMALIYIAYVLKKHRDEIVVMGKKISEEASKEI